MTTEKQTNYILTLLAKNGYSVRFMDRRYKDFGVTMRARSGTVESWIKGLNVAEASQLIDKLKSLDAQGGGSVVQSLNEEGHSGEWLDDHSG
jgi:pantothenate kinase